MIYQLLCIVTIYHADQGIKFIYCGSKIGENILICNDCRSVLQKKSKEENLDRNHFLLKL